MKLSPRRITFQLVSLFDLLMIVIFAQSLDVREKTRHEVAAASQEVEATRQQRQQLEAAVDELSRDRDRLATETRKLQFNLQEQARQSQAERNRLGMLVARLFQLPPDSLEKYLGSRSPAERIRIQQQLTELSQQQGGAIIRHLLTVEELEKRCDVWTIHLGDDNRAAFRAGDRQSRFFAATADEFKAELFRIYRTLPEPKSLVLILLSWSDADLSIRTAAIAGMQQATERMRADTEKRSRFEYAILGYVPAARH